MIHYTQNGLVITISSASPAADHVSLLHALSVGVRLALGNKEKTPRDADHLKFLMRLQEQVMPDEQELVKGYS